MSEQGGVDRAGRRRKRFLTPVEKYEIWVQLLRGEASIMEAADRARVDRSTIMKLRQVAKQGRSTRWRRTGRPPGKFVTGYRVVDGGRVRLAMHGTAVGGGRNPQTYGCDERKEKSCTNVRQ